MRRIAVLGGGITGLAAAYYALGDGTGVEVLLLEASARFGGLLRSESKDGYLLDAGPDAMLARKPAGLELCRSLGIDHLLLPRYAGGRAVYVRRGSTLHKLPSSMRMFVPLDEAELAASGLLSRDGVRRLYMEPQVPAAAAGLRSEPEPFSEQSIEQFFTRRFGAEMYRCIAEPLTAGVLGGDGAHLSMEANFAELVNLELVHGSVLRALRQGAAAPAASDNSAPPDNDIFRSFRHGMQVVSDELVNRLQTDSRCSTMLNMPVTGIARRRAAQPGHSRWTVLTAGGRSFNADAIVCALPADAAATVLADAAPRVAALLAEITRSRAAGVFLAFSSKSIPMPLDGSGYVVPRAEGSPVRACTWSSKKWPGRAPAGTELFRVFVEDGQGAADAVCDDTWLLRQARRELAATLKIEAQPQFTRVYRWPQAVTQYTLGHLRRRSEIEERLVGLQGLELAGSALDGVGIPDCIRSGRQAAARARG